MHWIYILECEDNTYYIGETKTLNKRIYQHKTGKGGKNTRKYGVKKLLAAYKLHTFCKFIWYHDHLNDVESNKTLYNNRILYNFDDDDASYNNLSVENVITEMMMNKYENVIGGKYTRENVKYKDNRKEIADLLCYCFCGLPCNISINSSMRIIFTCCKLNLPLEKKCDFFIEYNRDIKWRISDYERLKGRNLKLNSLLEDWLENVMPVKKNDNCDSCKEKCLYTGIVYNGLRRRLCEECLLNKSEILKLCYL